MTSRREFMVSTAGLVAGLASTSLAAPAIAQQRLKVNMAIGGLNWVPYAPVILARAMGMFEKHGIDLSLADSSTGGATINAVVANSADVGCGYFDHTAQVGSRGKAVQGFVLMTATPAISGFVLPGRDAIKGAKDLIGKKVSADPGGSTSFVLRHYLRKNGVDPSQVAIVATGQANTTVAAAQQGLMDACVTGEPATTVIGNQLKGVRMLFDTRTPEGAKELFGSDYPAATLYAQKEWIDKHPNEAQRLTDAIIETLAFIEASTPQQVVDKMPPEIQGTNKALYLELFTNMSHIFAKGGRFTEGGVKTCIEVLGSGIPEVAAAKLKPEQLYTNKFVDASKVGKKT
jgi:NitT/TauT family transport system substrate-binding protein